MTPIILFFPYKLDRFESQEWVMFLPFVLVAEQADYSYSSGWRSDIFRHRRKVNKREQLVDIINFK
jgi:hypothetical protein